MVAIPDSVKMLPVVPIRKAANAALNHFMTINFVLVVCALYLGGTGYGFVLLINVVAALVKMALIVRWYRRDGGRSW